MADNESDVDDTLTLQEAADALGVHYMTAYRYVRLGMLAADRRGRSWVVTASALDEFRRERDQRLSGAAGPARQHADWTRRLERRLVAGDQHGALGVLEGALAAGSTPVDLYVDVVAPAMEAIGGEWAAGRIDVAVEHRASVIMLQNLAVLGARFARRGVSRGVVVIGAAPGEQHSLPVRLVADAARLAGFEVHDLGADVPAPSFATTLADLDRLVAVGISATTPGREDEVRDAVVAVRATTDVPVFVGGGAIVDAASATALGADHWAPDARGVVEILEELVP